MNGRQNRSHALLFAFFLTLGAVLAAAATPTKTAEAIAWNQTGAKAGAEYKGDGLTVTRTESGARLHCAFHRLDGEATSEGLWLTSTVSGENDLFRVTAVAVGEGKDWREGGDWMGGNLTLPRFGAVSVEGQNVRFSRPGLTEEYAVSVDGVRQDFIVEQSLSTPAGGELVLTLALTGARVEPAACGATLVLENSGRKIAYSRLRASDATGRELPARIEVLPAEDKATSFNSWMDRAALFGEPDFVTPAAPMARLAIVVNAADVTYPIRIDPTFSDANWASMGSFPGANGEVSAAVVDDSGNLYIGGAFTVVGNTVANYVAEWNGATWAPLGSGMNHPVFALAISGGTLYAGGEFTTAGGVAASNIAQWDGTNWSPLGSGMNYPILALAISGDTLYAGGYFTTAGGVTASNIAQWDGNVWSPVGPGLGGEVNAFTVSGATLYAGCGQTVAEWDGSNWTPLGSGVSGSFPSLPPFYVTALAVSGGNVYAGGVFTTAGGSPATYIALWNGSSWSAMGGGLSTNVYALAASSNTVYAGGAFTNACGAAVNYVAQWNGSSWMPLGLGIGNPVYAAVNSLAVSGNTLYAGGTFTTAGGIAATNIAQWNGSNWSSVGSGLEGNFVSALAVSGNTLYAGGWFTNAGGVAVNNIAAWNGSSWAPLGSGGGVYVYALAVSGNTLYAAGYLLASRGGSQYIEQWNGSAWSALGSGVNSFVYALAVSGNALYAGGTFTTAGGIAATHIAQWNGSAWSALGSGVNGFVYALAVSGNALYAGGWFTNAGGIPANYIARWDGTTWSALGSGMNSNVLALAVSGNTLYAGGQFTTAGNQISCFAAQAALAVTPVPLAIITMNTDFGFAHGMFGFDVWGPSGSNVVIQESADLQNWAPLQTNTLDSTGLVHFAQSPAGSRQFYRAVLP
jgi:hypothetical protein